LQRYNKEIETENNSQKKKNNFGAISQAYSIRVVPNVFRGAAIFVMVDK